MLRPTWLFHICTNILVRSRCCDGPTKARGRERSHSMIVPGGMMHSSQWGGRWGPMDAQALHVVSIALFSVNDANQAWWKTPWTKTFLMSHLLLHQPGHSCAKGGFNLKVMFCGIHLALPRSNPHLGQDNDPSGETIVGSWEVQGPCHRVAPWACNRIWISSCVSHWLTAHCHKNGQLAVTSSCNTLLILH